ncbi:MAG: hypothetical protein E7Z73_07890 [Methanobrevibacter millerae]|uniref:Phage-related protein n=1 Tax=Methanobrevibacter millerae TaxID=230361 RepID=A0A8T3VEM9_9EURY|nr:hypothetical protein [Methanobrevibacter millerae]MBE6505642.1 hypothetical protein [Methanobrevibacter millerae]
MVSQQQIDIIIRAEDRATAIIEKVEAQLSNVKNLALGLNNNFNTASNGANRLSTNLSKINALPFRQVSQESLQLQSRLLLIAGNVNVLNNSMKRISGSNFNQVESNVKLLDTTLNATKGSANQLDNALDSIGGSTGMNQTVSTAEMLRAIIVILIGIGQELKMILDSLANNGLDDAARDADQLREKLLLAGDAGRNTQNSFKGTEDSTKKLGNSFGFLRSAASMTVGMIGFDLVNSMVQGARASINATASFERFAQRLEGMSGPRLQEFTGHVREMQNEFRKVDMNAVAASALEMGVKLQLPQQSMEQLTKTTAVMSSAFVKEGRTQEDAILAVSDAMDGQFRRLQELGISQDMLMKNGWDGDINNKTSLLQAMNKTLDDMGFTQTASEIVTLDDAWAALTVTGSQLIASVLVPITPLIIGLVDGFTNLVKWIQNNGWAQGALLIGGVAFGILLLAGAAAAAETTIWGLVVSAMPGFITSLWGAAAAIGGVTLAGAPLWAIVAVIAAIAIAVYELGIAFGWWKDVGTMFEAIADGVKRLWAAFINNPNVQGFLKDLKQAWDDICTALQPVYDWAKQVWTELFPPGTKIDIVRMIIDAFGALGDTIAFIVRAISGVQGAFNTFLSFLGYVTNPVMFVVDVLRKIICILLGCSPGIVPALRKTWEVFQEVFNAIAGFVSGIISPIVEAIRPLIDIFVEIVTYLVEMFMPAWNLLSNILLVIWNAVSQLINIFQAFLSGQITLPQMLTMIWNLIMTAYMTILTMIINFVFQWAGQIVSAAINAASGFVNGIINYISGLPGRFFSYLAQTTCNIINAGSQWVNTARQKAGEMVNSASTTVQQLPGKIYTEFTKVPDRIREAIPQAIAAALNFGKEIINGVLNAMGIHSPGIIQNSITDEFKNSVQKIKDAIKPAGEYARQVGAEIVDKFGEPKLSLDTDDLMPYYDLDENPLENVDLASMDLSSVSGGLDSAMGMTDDTNVMIGESYDALATMMMTTLQNMVLQDQLAYGQIQSNDLTTFQNISTGLNLNLLSMSNNLRTQLNLMLLTHRTAMTSATNTTRQQLALMLNETMKVTSEMRSAWAVMADSIISAAARIKNEATAYFDQLSSTIGTFYRKLQNPSQWAGGDSTGSPSTIRRVGRDPAVMTRITRGVANSLRRDNQLPYTITAVKAMDNGLVSPVTLEYMDKTASDNLNLIDLIQRGACPNCFAGGWDAVADPNIAYIKQTAREWQMKGPAVHTGVGDIDTGLSFRVKDFEGGTPHISWESFVRIATAIASAIPYELYYNSDAHGSWQNAIAAGSWNCYDGASAMVALANTCGYGGYVDCGLNWGGFGHCAAIINGYTFDTTALRQRGGWTAGPCSYSHPAPSAGGPINVHIPGGRSAPRTHSNPLEGLFDNNNSRGNVEEVKLTLEHKVDVTVDGNVENIGTDALIKELTESVTDKRLIDRIADALIKRDKRIARMGGA